MTAWCLFDFASSSYTTLIVTVVFAVYFREVVVGAADNRGDQLWGFANFLAMLTVALTSPILGAVADYAGLKKALLVLTTLQTIGATSLLYFAAPGQVTLSIVVYVVATVGFEAGYVFYNAFLPDISTPTTMGRISGWGWGIGYLGGLASLLLCVPWIVTELRDAAGALVPEAVQDRRNSFLIVAGFYLVFAVPAFIWLREPRGRSRSSIRQSARKALTRVGGTLRRLGRYREVAKFVVASLFFTDAITTIIVFSATFATVTFGFGSRELVLVFVVTNLIAFPSTVVAGYLADRLGAKPTLVFTLLLWIALVFLAYFAQSKTMFWVMAIGVASGMGATQAVGRSFMAELSPPERKTEFFGFYVTSGKFASIFGPLLFGTISAWSGSQRLAVLALLPLFVIGLMLMLWVDVPAARRAAAGAPDPH